MSFKKSVGWADLSINPIKGRCKGGCWYCYYSGKRGMLNRFKQDPEIRLDLTVFDSLPKTPKKIFLCSTHDLFGSWIPDDWRNKIFFDIQLRPQHTFQILTKFPQNIDRPMPDNVWLGTSITNPDDFESRSYHLGKKDTKAKLKYWSIEPLLGDILEPMLDKDGSWKYIAEEEKIRWIIIGRLTEYGHKYDPKWDWINHIVSYARHYRIPVFLKDNLIPIMGKEWVMKFREFPE